MQMTISLGVARVRWVIINGVRYYNIDYKNPYSKTKQPRGC